MKKVLLFLTKLGWGYYFYFDNLNLYLISTSSICDFYIIPLNINFDNKKLIHYKINSSLKFRKELLNNAEEINYRKYLYNDFTDYSHIQHIPRNYFTIMNHISLHNYEYLKLFAVLYNREEKIKKILK